MNIADKTLQLKKDFDDVYKAGQSSMVDESKIIEKTVSGEYISVDDVSEVPHEVKVMLTSGGKNLWSKGDATLIQASTYDIKLYAGITYTMSAVVTSDDTDNTLCLIYDLTNDKELGCLERNIRSSITFTPTADIYKLYMYAGRNYPTSAGDTATFSDIMIEENDTATEYEPYKETLTDYSNVAVSVGTNESEITQILTVNTDGTVEGVESTSPYMYMTTDNQNVTINATYHKSYGMQTEYDRFWDNAQRKGTLNNYRGFFVGPAWTPKTLTPKYLIKPLDTTNITQFGNLMFQYCNFGNSNLIDFRTIADKFDFSEMKMANNMFDSAYMDNIYCNFKNARNLQYTFSANWASKITTVTLYVSSTCTEYNNTFTYLSTLQNLTFEKGSEIAGSINFQWSTKLTKASILSIFNALSATKSGLTLTLSKTAVTNAFGSTTATEWTNLVATKTNWTISLV